MGGGSVVRVHIYQGRCLLGVWCSLPVVRVALGDRYYRPSHCRAEEIERLREAESLYESV